MDADAFSDYPREECLSNILAEREKLDETDKPSGERSSRQAKTLIPAGQTAKAHDEMA